MQPGLNHTVGTKKERFFFACAMDADEWEYFKSTMNEREEFHKDTTYRRWISDCGEKRLVSLHKIGWSGIIPGMASEVRRSWVIKKWVHPATLDLYRHRLLDLFIIWNSWTGLCRLEMKYASYVRNSVLRLWQTGLMS